MTRHTLVLSHAGLAATALAVALAAGHPAAQQPPVAARVVATDASTYRPLTAVHAGAGNMAFAGLLNRGAIGPHFNFLHRGEIPGRQRHRAPLSQHRRRDVRHPQRRSAVHGQRPHRAHPGSGCRRLPHGRFARHPQHRHRDAAVDELPGEQRRRRHRCLRPGRRSRRRDPRSGADVPQRAARPRIDPSSRGPRAGRRGAAGGRAHGCDVAATVRAQRCSGRPGRMSITCSSLPGPARRRTRTSRWARRTTCSPAAAP